MDFVIAVVAKLVHFSHDLSDGPAFFAATRERHNAVRAELVTTFDDRNESYVRRSAIGCGNIPNIRVTSLIQINHSPLSIERLIDQPRQTICRPSSDDQIDRRRTFEERLTFELCHTSHHTEHRRRADALAADFTNARE